MQFDQFAEEFLKEMEKAILEEMDNYPEEVQVQIRNFAFGDSMEEPKVDNDLLHKCLAYRIFLKGNEIQQLGEKPSESTLDRTTHSRN